MNANKVQFNTKDWCSMQSLLKKQQKKKQKGLPKILKKIPKDSKPRKSQRVGGETTLRGILQHKKGKRFSDKEYQLHTEDGPVDLEIKKQFKEILKDYVWDKLIIKGKYMAFNLFQVNSVHLETEEDFELDDLTKSFDLEYYKALAKKGFAIEPYTEETA